MFSEKYGYQVAQDVQYEMASDKLRNRIWNVFYSYDIQAGGLKGTRVNLAFKGERTIDMKVADKFGFKLDGQFDNSPLKHLEKMILKGEWYLVFDFIEIHLSCLDDKDRSVRAVQYNEILESEKSGYRIINYQIAPITNKEEIDTVEQAITTPYDNVNQHIKKSLAFYSNSKNPDYENSIKESISAVESMCLLITGMKGANATLSRAIKKLKESGIYIHPTLESAFNKLYGYASDENGVRHGSIDASNVSPEDTKFMLIACSAFVNYLVEKYRKALLSLDDDGNEIG